MIKEQQEAMQRRKEVMHSLFVTALEGGIGYWSECSEYRWATDEDGRTEDWDGFRAVLHPAGADEADVAWGMWDDQRDREPLIVDRDVIELGLKRFQEWMLTDKRNSVGAPVKKDMTDDWQGKPSRPENRYWSQFSFDWQFGKFDQIDFDALLADAIVQLGLFDELMYG